VKVFAEGIGMATLTNIRQVLKKDADPFKGLEQLFRCRPKGERGGSESGRVAAGLPLGRKSIPP